VLDRKSLGEVAGVFVHRTGRELGGVSESDFLELMQQGVDDFTTSVPDAYDDGATGRI
jgi:hypothetical protein